MFYIPLFRHETLESDQIAVLLTGDGIVVAIEGGNFDSEAKTREIKYVILGQVDMGNLPEPRLLQETGKLTPKGMVDTAAQALAEGDFIKARFLAKHAAELQPGLADALLILGMVHVKAGKRDNAKRSYEKALELYKESNNWERRALVLKLLGRNSEAEALHLKIETKAKEPIPAIHNGVLKPMEFRLATERSEAK